ncbi:MAG: hypothetical protein ACRDJW_17785 [Thermomicrobiales bacterium]
MPKLDPKTCAVPGCYGPRLPGRFICSLHLHEDVGRQVQVEARRLDTEIRFQQRRELGDYGALYEEPLRAILEDAGDNLMTTDELGAVRYALARLLAEEDDPGQLGSGVARLVSAAATLVRTHVATADHPTNRAIARIRDEPNALPTGEPPALPPASETEPLDLPDEGWPMQRDCGPLIPLFDDEEE